MALEGRRHGYLWLLNSLNERFFASIIKNSMIHTTNIPVRFSDIDAMGHVNNAIYLNYFEQARMQFFEDHIGGDWDWKKDGIVLARNEVDYLRPILLGDKVLIDTHVESMGKKSLTFRYEVYNVYEGDRKLYARGKSVIVCFDYSSGNTTEVPDLWREQFTNPNESIDLPNDYK